MFRLVHFFKNIFSNQSLPTFFFFTCICMIKQICYFLSKKNHGKDENCYSIYRKKWGFFLLLFYFQTKFQWIKWFNIPGGLITLDCASQFLFIYMYYLWWPMILKIAQYLNQQTFLNLYVWVLDAGGCGITNTIINF